MASEHTTGIYEIRNLVNGKRYVGSAVDFANRWRIHAQSLKRGDHHSKALQRAWHLYGPGAFHFNKLIACTKDNLIMYEQAVMDALAPEYNIVPRAGSQLGYRHTEESRRRMSESRRKDFSPMTGRTHTEATRAKISANRKGKSSGPMTEERRANISAALKGRTVAPEMRARISATLTGHKQSPEQIEKRMRKLRGRKMPPGFAEGQRQRMLGTKATPEMIRKNGLARASLSESQVHEIRKSLSAGVRNSMLAKAYDIDPSIVSNIKRGLAYHWVI